MPLDQLYKQVASSGEHERFIAFLRAVQADAADIRTIESRPVTVSEDVQYQRNKGAVAILGTMIDRIRSARQNLQQRPGGLNTEAD